jgi:LmbE family N-acetylglucosaminyl deacetylase
MLTDLGQTVGIMAHPDDLWYSAAATLQDAVLSGGAAVSVCATSGEAGSQDEDRWPAALMGPHREAEETAAMASIGGAVEFWRYPDGHLDRVCPVQAVARTCAAIERHQPDTLITYGPDGLTGHSDHRRVYDWVAEAHRRTGARARLLLVTATPEWNRLVRPVLDHASAMYGPQYPYVTPDPRLDLDHRLSPVALTQKLRGIVVHHESQSTPLLRVTGGLRPLLPWFGRETFVLA